MKNKLLILIIGILLIGIVSAVPKIEPYVNDYADLLTKEQINYFNNYIDTIEKNTSWEIALVTLQNTEGQDRVEYANKIGDENGVGKKDKDNGIVILYSLDNEKGGAIATGRYSESILNDAKVGRIGREAKQLCDEVKYYECFDYIIKELEKEIKGENNMNITNSSVIYENSLNILLVIIGVLPLIYFIIRNNFKDYSEDSNINNKKKYKKKRKINYVPTPIFTGSSSSKSSSNNSSSSSGRSGGSYGSFGGGSFSGGGSKF